jgi:SM-20-related protein
MLATYSAIPKLKPNIVQNSTQIAVIDDFIASDLQSAVQQFLLSEGWGYGAFSSNDAGASRYWYKHFAGYFRDGREPLTPESIEQELMQSAPIWRLWELLKSSHLAKHQLTRCYANAYPVGSEGGLHKDSNEPNHYTVIYYPHSTWHPNWAGETIFFNSDGTDIVSSVYPKPNRLVIFPGYVPHVARGISRSCPELRVTLMFKTCLPSLTAGT